jgi:hypothetical protein
MTTKIEWMNIFFEVGACQQPCMSSVHVQHHVGDFFFHLATSHRTTSLEAECIIVDDFSFFFLT